MNREELTEAIHDLARTPHMSTYALENAMALLPLQELAELFDAVADHHDVLHVDVAAAARRGPVDLGRSAGGSTEGRTAVSSQARLCAHAHFDGRGAHWLEPGEVCAFAQF
jgi:hypothetical protein